MPYYIDLLRSVRKITYFLENPLHANNPQLMTGLSELLSLTRIRYTQVLDPSSLIKFLSLSAVSMGYYIRPSILKNLNLMNLDHGLNQLQYICSTTTDNQYNEEKLDDKSCWNEIILAQEPPEKVIEYPCIPSITDISKYLNAKTYISTNINVLSCVFC